MVLKVGRYHSSSHAAICRVQIGKLLLFTEYSWRLQELQTVILMWCLLCVSKY